MHKNSQSHENVGTWKCTALKVKLNYNYIHLRFTSINIISEKTKQTQYYRIQLICSTFTYNQDNFLTIRKLPRGTTSIVPVSLTPTIVCSLYGFRISYPQIVAGKKTSFIWPEMFRESCIPN